MSNRLEIGKLVSYVEKHAKVAADSRYSRVLLQISDPVMTMPSESAFATMIDALKPSVPKSDTFTGDGGFDCDDFAFILKGLVAKWRVDDDPNGLPLAFGVAWGRFRGFGNGQYHALNWVAFSEDRKIRWVEPQRLHGAALSDALKPFSPKHDRLSLMIA